MGVVRTAMLRLALALTLICAVSALPTSSLWQRWGHNPNVDPLGKHCFDVTVDTSDAHAAEWLRGNEYLYTKWKNGLCDSSVWPAVESKTHPGVSTKVTLRKLGHGKAMAEAMVGKSKDCRSNKTTEAISIAFTNGADGHSAKIRGCQNQYACKPYQDCELALPDGATETIIIDSSFKYFVFTFKPAEGETELYPDANMKYPEKYTIKTKKQEAIAMAESSGDSLTVYQPSPGSHAHCVEITFEGGKNNPYYLAHGYQYQPPLWKTGSCPNPPYNWFNNNKTIAKGVTQTMMGRHTESVVEDSSAPAAPFCLHHVDAADHKCFEYCQADSKTFADKDVDSKGPCDASYNTVDKTHTIKQCPDGVTNLRYCKATAVDVVVKIKGQAGQAEMMAPEDNSAYCMNDKSKHAPFYCHCPPLPANCKTDKDCQR